MRAEPLKRPNAPKRRSGIRLRRQPRLMPAFRLRQSRLEPWLPWLTREWEGEADRTGRVRRTCGLLTRHAHGSTRDAALRRALHSGFDLCGVGKSSQGRGDLSEDEKPRQPGSISRETRPKGNRRSLSTKGRTSRTSPKTSSRLPRRSRTEPGCRSSTPTSSSTGPRGLSRVLRRPPRTQFGGPAPASTLCGASSA